jgi:L,D-peptidoglycan transpeptidase YkuD (ErfK/YbiS/YcfS/YnhG family)
MENIVVRTDKLLWKGKEYKVALGKGGIVSDKKEGDGATPNGCFPIREIFYREDRISKPKTATTIRSLSDNDGWSDDVSKPEYNQLVKLPYDGSHEKLWREDEVYDIIVVLGYNDSPPVQGKGSAIFMHIARPTYSPTLGCIALKREDLIEVIESIPPNVSVCVEAD